MDSGRGNFELTPYEAALFGVRWRPPRLRLASSLPLRILECVAAIVGAGLLVAAVPLFALGESGAGAWLVVVGGYLAGQSLSFLRLATVATPDALEVRGPLRARDIPWADIVGIDVLVTGRPTNRDRWSRQMTLSDWRFGIWSSKAIPMLRLSDGSAVALHSITSLAGRDSFSGSDPSPAELKTALVGRYQGWVLDREPLYPARAVSPEQPGGSATLPAVGDAAVHGHS